MSQICSMVQNPTNVQCAPLVSGLNNLKQPHRVKRGTWYLRLQDTTDDEESTAAIDCKLAAIMIG